MSVLERAAFATLLFSLGCGGGTEPPKVKQEARAQPAAVPGQSAVERPAAEPTAEPAEAPYPPACDDYLDALISFKQSQKDAGMKVDVPDKEVHALAYRREAAKRDYDSLAEMCARGINMVMNQMEKQLPPSTMPPEAPPEPAEAP